MSDLPMLYDLSIVKRGQNHVRSSVLCSLVLAFCAGFAALDPTSVVGQDAQPVFDVAEASHNTQAGDQDALIDQLRVAHLTTNDGLSQGYVTAILQDRRGFMWFATRDGLNRYDGNSFVVYKNNPTDPASLSSSFIQDLLEDEQGNLWIATNTGNQ